VPDRPTLCYPFCRWIVIIQTLQRATKQSTQGVCHGRRANRKRANRRRANRRRANRRRANRRTCNDGRANSGSWIGCGSRIGRGSRIDRGSANGRVRSQGFWLSRGSQLSRRSRGRWFLRGWPGGVIGPLSFPLSLFGPLLQDVHQCPPDSILPTLTIQNHRYIFFWLHASTHHGTGHVWQIQKQPRQSPSSSLLTPRDSALAFQLSGIPTLEIGPRRASGLHPIVPSHLQTASGL